MSRPFDYVSNGVWHDQGQGQCQPQGYQNIYYQNSGTSQNVQSHTPAYISSDPRFCIPQSVLTNIPPSPYVNMQWTASMMTPNMNPNMMVPMMSNVAPNTSFNMAPNLNGYGFCGEYGYYPVSQPCNALHIGSSRQQTDGSDSEEDFDMEPGVPYFFINGKPVSMVKKDDDKEKNNTEVPKPKEPKETVNYRK